MQTDKLENISSTINNEVLNKGSFSVHSYSVFDINNSNKYVHWSKGLKMIIEKNGITINLEEDEIKQLVKCLPQTLGGSY